MPIFVGGGVPVSASAGNTNKELIQELKDYIKLALHESTINKTDGQLILKKLNNNK